MNETLMTIHEIRALKVSLEEKREKLWLKIFFCCGLLVGAIPGFAMGLYGSGANVTEVRPASVAERPLPARTYAPKSFEL